MDMDMDIKRGYLGNQYTIKMKEDTNSGIYIHIDLMSLIL